MPHAATPDEDRIPFGFEADGRRHRVRTCVWSSVLVPGAFSVGTVLAPFASPRAVARGERLWARAVLAALGVDARVDGIELIDASTPYVVLPLHESFVDVPLLLRLPIPMTFVVREEIFGFPHIGPYLSATHQIPIGETPSVADLRRLLAAASDTAAQGTSVVVFPQGSILGIETAFQRGATWFAHQIGLPVLPVVITGTHRVWEYPYSQTLRLGQPIRMKVLEPIPSADVTPDRMRAIERTMKEVALASPVQPRRYVPQRDGWWDGYRFRIDPDFPEVFAAVAERRRQPD
jgi:1-acyl-sn-glycerol-3-phosphate acyltransferase